VGCSYECKLCLTLHNNEGNYLAHTQGKRHQTNLAKRAAREAKDAPAQPQPNKRKVNPRKTGIRLNFFVHFAQLSAIQMMCLKPVPDESRESICYVFGIPGTKSHPLGTCLQSKLVDLATV